jgi:CheY-like chemotaxis protein
MNAIVGFSELLNDQDMNSETREGFIDLINQNSRLLLRLIEDIIDIAKIESDQLRIVKSTCQISQIFDDFGISYRNYLREKGINDVDFIINKGIAGDDFSISSDPYRFKQIMNNLISNAIKFTKKGSVEIGYREHDNKNILFYIKDSGIGLPPNKVEVIFERFRQAEESSTKEYGGTGLGLTISKKLVELLGGTIWVESVVNEGSVFYFTLPNVPVARNVVVRMPKKKQEVFDWSGKKILVVEDEYSNFELVEAILFQTKVEIIHATNGKEAVDICRQKDDIDVVLMDMRMPVMNGYEATEIIKAEKKDLPIISLTAYAMAEDRQKSIMAGCDDYISKPIIPMKFIETINKFIE